MKRMGDLQPQFALGRSKACLCSIWNGSGGATDLLGVSFPELWAPFLKAPLSGWADCEYPNSQMSAPEVGRGPAQTES